MKRGIVFLVSVLILTCLFVSTAGAYPDPGIDIPLGASTTTDLGLIKPVWTDEEDILDDLNANSNILEAFANDPLEFDTGTRLEDRVDVVLSTWAGDTDITTLGTVTTGVWQGTAIVDAYVSNTLTVTGYMEDTDVNTFAKLNAWVTDQTLIHSGVTTLSSLVSVGTIGTGVWQGTAIADGYIPNNITIDLATLATTFTCTDNESEALACPVVFVDGATGTQGAETDDVDFTYNPSTGALTAKMHRVYMVSETTALNAAWYQITSTVVTGDLTGLRAVMTANAASGGDAAAGVNVRGVYGQAVCAASKHAGLLQGGLFTASAAAGSCTVYNVHVLCGHYSSGASTTIGGDLYVGYLRSQTREDNARSVTGSDSILAIENEAIQGDGGTVDCGIRIFSTNVSGSVIDFTYGIDMTDAGITTDIRLSETHTIVDSASGILMSLLSPSTISGLGDVTSADADYILIWDATDSTLKKCDMGEVRGAGAGGATTALDNLASVQINTSLLSDTADTDSLGTTAAEWLNLYIGDAGKIYCGLGQDTSIHRSAANTMTLTASSGVVLSAGLTVGGDLILGANSIGRDADNDIDFETDNSIKFRVSGADKMEIYSTGELDMNTNSVGFTLQTATGDGTTTMDWKLGNKFKFTFGAQNETFTFTAPTNPCTLMLTLIQDATGSRTVTWPATVKWAGGTAPTLTTTANARDKVALDWDGAQYDGVCSKDFK